MALLLGAAEKLAVRAPKARPRESIVKRPARRVSTFHQASWIGRSVRGGRSMQVKYAVLREGSEPDLDQFFRNGRRCEYARLSNDTRDQIRGLNVMLA